MAKWDVELRCREVKITVSEFCVARPGMNGNAVIHITDDGGGKHAVPQSHFAPIDLRRLKKGSVITLALREQDAGLLEVSPPEPIPEDIGQLDLFEKYPSAQSAPAQRAPGFF